MSPKLGREFFSFSWIGICSNLFAFGIYLSLADRVMTPGEAVAILYPIGVIIGYLGNRRFTFQHQGKLMSSGIRYLLVYGFGYLINLALIFVLVNCLGYPHQVVQAGAVFLVALVSFILLRLFVFNHNSSV